MPCNIYLKTLHDLRDQILAWSAGLMLLAAANVLIYPTVQQMPDMITFLENMPPVFKAMIGDVRAMLQIEGFLRAKFFEPLPLLLSIFAVSQGANLVAGELELKSMDLLLARPVPRWRVVAGKFLALVTATVIMTGALIVSLLVCVQFIDTDISYRYMILSACNGLPLTWFFAGLALIGSTQLPRARQSAMLVGGIVVASYVFETMRMLSPAIRGWDKVSVFAYQKAGVSLYGEVGLGSILLLVALTVLATVVAALVFERRDLAS
jgi:beta-exotoxin I transport system permease protein